MIDPYTQSHISMNTEIENEKSPKIDQKTTITFEIIMIYS